MNNIKHIVIGTPCYGCMVNMEYTESLLALKDICARNDIKLTCMFLGNESLIQRGRNKIAHYFLKTDATHLMFIDADQKFRPNDIIRMINADKGIIGGAVPMKGIDWERVRQGAKNDHTDLESLTGIFNVNKLDGHDMIDPNIPFQVKHVGTGFMLIRRNVFEELKPHVGFYNNGNRNNQERFFDFFKVQNINNELLSEDYNFCHMYRQIGGSVWVAPWCVLGHYGAYCFSGQYCKDVV